MEKELINIGKIVNTQGHKGEVKIISLTDFPERFKDMKSALINNNGQMKNLTIEGVRNHKQFIVIKFKEIPDMNHAEKLKNSFIQVKQEDLVELEKGQYYIFKLIGLSVFNEENELLGEIKDVIKTGANDVYVIKDNEGNEMLVPAIKDVVKDINLEEKKVVISPMEEY